MQKTEIFADKLRATVYVGVGLLFVAIAAGMLATGFARPFSGFGLAIIVSVIFFGTSTIVFIGRLLDPKPLLVLDDAGISDHSTLTSVGLVRWRDVRAFAEHSIYGQPFLAVEVRNPENYIEEGRNWFVRRVLKMNQGWYGTPICINTGALAIEIKDLLRQLEDGLKKSQKVLEP